LLLDDGGTGLLELDERSAASPDRGICSKETFSRLRYIQRNIVAPSVPTNTQLITPTPKKTLMIQMSKGKHIAALEEETHKACTGCRIRSC